MRKLALHQDTAHNMNERVEKMRSESWEGQGTTRLTDRHDYTGGRLCLVDERIAAVCGYLLCLKSKIGVIQWDSQACRLTHTDKI